MPGCAGDSSVVRAVDSVYRSGSGGSGDTAQEKSLL